MLPLLRDGDLVHVQPCPRTSCPLLRPGRLILFERAGQPIVHRLVRVHEGRLWERGDRLPETREIQRDQVIGVVLARRRGDRQQLLGLPLLWRLRNLIPFPGGGKA